MEERCVVRCVVWAPDHGLLVDAAEGPREPHAHHVVDRDDGHAAGTGGRRGACGRRQHDDSDNHIDNEG